MDYVLDTSALMTLLKDEEGAEDVEKVLAASSRGQSRTYLPFMSLMGLEYMVLRQKGQKIAEGVLRLIQTWPVERVESSPEWGSEAALVKSRASLSVADAWNAALALRVDAELVHKDPEFDRVPGLKHRRLPYKKP